MEFVWDFRGRIKNSFKHQDLRGLEGRFEFFFTFNAPFSNPVFLEGGAVLIKK